ncbi:MAG: hypothetical protein JNL83_25615 [Myxococcales bacterium]|nr:hypothetical protein [Myxococcales bacterium]
MERREAPAGAPGPAPSTEPAIPTPASRQDGITAAPVKTDAASSGPVAIARVNGLDDSTLTVDAVTARIRATYLSGVRRCAGGRAGAVELAFTVAEGGRVVAATTGSAFDVGVAACIATLAKTWRFRVPTSAGSRPPAKARFAMTFTLGS